MHDQALGSRLAHNWGNTLIANAGIVFSGTVFMALLSQFVIPLPFTPVPITGQTFGVAVMSLLWGSKRAASSYGLYMVVGAMGLPVFAEGGSGLVWGPTTGYLIGMGISTYVVGLLADRGYTKNFLGAWGCAYVGSAITFACGLAVLAAFVPASHLLVAGLLPFLPGDFLKTGLAAFISSRVQKIS